MRNKIINKNKVRKILIIKLKGIGDVVLSTIVFNNLLKDFPYAKIDFLTEVPSLPVLNNLNFINKILLLKKSSFIDTIKLYLKIFFKRYDLVLDLYSNPRTAFITFLSFAKYRAGFPYRGRKYAYNLFGPIERNKYHSAELHLLLLKSIRLSYDERDLFFGLKEESIKMANDFFNKNFNDDDLIVGLCPSGGWKSKRCDSVKFAEIGDAIAKKYNAKIIILWGKEDLNDAKEIQSLMKLSSTLIPETNINQLGAFLAKCDLVIANDSGPMHIASALKTPVLGLFGPTDPKLQGPFGEQNEWIRLEELDCIGCNLLECPIHHECFKNLSIDKILDKIDNLLNKNKLNYLINEKN